MYCHKTRSGSIETRARSFCESNTPESSSCPWGESTRTQRSPVRQTVLASLASLIR